MNFNLLIQSVQSFNAISTKSEEDFNLMEQSILKGMAEYGFILDEYGDLFFEKEYVRFLLLRDDVVKAFSVASFENQYLVPKYPVLFARYYERNKQYKKASYFYLLQGEFSWNKKTAAEFEKKSLEVHLLWLQQNALN